jgi:hypothetical protein
MNGADKYEEDLILMRGLVGAVLCIFLISSHIRSLQRQIIPFFVWDSVKGIPCEIGWRRGDPTMNSGLRFLDLHHTVPF